MFTITCIFFGNNKPNIILENIMNAHLSRFKLMPYFLHFWKHSLSFLRWLSMSLYIVKLSKNIFIKLSKYSLNVLVIAFYYLGGPFLISNNITFYIKATKSITNAILYFSSRAIKIWWYHEYPSKKEYVSYPTIVFNTSSMKSNGYGSFFVATFNFLKSI